MSIQPQVGQKSGMCYKSPIVEIILLRFPVQSICGCSCRWGFFHHLQHSIHCERIILHVWSLLEHTFGVCLRRSKWCNPSLVNHLHLILPLKQQLINTNDEQGAGAQWPMSVKAEGASPMREWGRDYPRDTKDDVLPWIWALFLNKSKLSNRSSIWQLSLPTIWNFIFEISHHRLKVFWCSLMLWCMILFSSRQYIFNMNSYFILLFLIIFIMMC